MIQVGIIGGAGYTAGELIRLLMFHKEAEINFVYSTSNAGNQISKVHQDLEGSLNLKFTGSINPNVDVLFLCLGHGNSIKFLEVNICNSIRVVAYAVCFVLPGSNFCFGVSFQDSKEFSEYFMVAIFI